MNEDEQLPEGAVIIPEEEEKLPEGAIKVSEPDENGVEQLPEGAVIVQEPPGPFEHAKALGERYASGFTAGLSKVVETHGIPGIFGPVTTPENIRRREEDYPVSGGALEIIGAMTNPLIGIGGRAAARAFGLGRYGAVAFEGGLYNAAATVNDDWSQNKPLDAERIVINTGLGALLGIAGTKATDLIFGKPARGVKIGEAEPIVKAPKDAETWAAKSAHEISEDIGEPVIAPRSAGPGPKTIREMAERNENARLNGTGETLPRHDIAVAAASRIDMGPFPVIPAQLSSLETKAKTDIWQYIKEIPNSNGQTIKQYESNQKYKVLVPGIQNEIQNLAPGYPLASSSSEAGSRATELFTKALAPLRTQYGKIVAALKKTKIEDVSHFTHVLIALMDKLPGVSQMLKFDQKSGKYIIRSWNSRMDIPQNAYRNIKQTLESILEKNPNLEELFALRKNLESGINLLELRNGGPEVATAKTVMMDYIQDLIHEVAPNEGVREAFRNYARTMENIEFVEKQLGAVIGSDNFRSLAKGKAEENILGKIFLNTETVKATRSILGEKAFNKILADYLNLSKQRFTNLGEFSSNRFGTFLKGKQDVLKTAFEGNPKVLSDINDMVTLARLLPDAAPLVVGSGKTILHTLDKMNFHNMTWESFLMSLPKKALKEVNNYYDTVELNRAISGSAEKAYWGKSLQEGAKKVGISLDKLVDDLFKGFAKQSSKVDFNEEK